MLGRRVGEFLGVGLPLGHRDVAGLAHEPRELLVGHLGPVHPEAVEPAPGAPAWRPTRPRRPHPELASRNPDHPLGHGPRWLASGALARPGSRRPLVGTGRGLGGWRLIRRGTCTRMGATPRDENRETDDQARRDAEPPSAPGGSSSFDVLDLLRSQPMSILLHVRSPQGNGMTPASITLGHPLCNTSAGPRHAWGRSQ